MTNLAVFTFSGHDVRVDAEAGAFVAADVCAALGIEDVRHAVQRLDTDERVVVVVHTLGGPQRTSAVTESGLYHLIFMSRKPEAAAFRRWVTGDVLPAIRRTGRYEHKAQPRRVGGIEIGIELENHDHQRAASKTLAGASSGTADVIEKRIGLSLAVSGQRPKDVREMGRVLGFKKRERESAPQVWRTLGVIEAPVYSAMALMVAFGAPVDEAAKHAGQLRDAIGRLRGAFLDAGVDPSMFSSMPREQFDRLLAEHEERKRANERQLSLFPGA